jgi:lipopolysaccharide heptosyltransferase II
MSTTGSPQQRRYGFVKPSLIHLFTVVDAVGDALTAPFRRSGNLAQPSSILLINLAHIGDVLLTTPAIAALRERFPHAHIAMLVSPWSKDIVTDNPRLDEVMVYRPSWWDRNRGSPYLVWHEFATLVNLLRRKRFDCVLNFKSFFQENLAVALAGIPRRVGYGLYGGGFLQTDLVPIEWNKHIVLQHLSLAQALGASSPNPKPEIYPSPQDEAASDHFLAETAPPHAGHLRIALHVGAGYPSKLWPVERYAQLASILAVRYDAACVLVGGKDDLPVIERMQGSLRAPCLIAAGKLSLPETAALLKRCDVFVGNDSGPAHIAAAMGTPTVVIFSGENDAELWKPWGDPVIVLQHKPVCWRCGLRVCNRDHACMTEITVEQVLAAVEQLLPVSASPSAYAHRP